MKELHEHRRPPEGRSNGEYYSAFDLHMQVITFCCDETIVMTRYDDVCLTNTTMQMLRFFDAMKTLLHSGMFKFASQII